MTNQQLGNIPTRTRFIVNDIGTEGKGVLLNLMRLERGLRVRPEYVRLLAFDSNVSAAELPAEGGAQLESLGRGVFVEINTGFDPRDIERNLHTWPHLKEPLAICPDEAKAVTSGVGDANIRERSYLRYAWAWKTLSTSLADAVQGLSQLVPAANTYIIDDRLVYIQVGFTGAANFSGGSKLAALAARRAIDSTEQKNSCYFLTFATLPARLTEKDRLLANAAAWLKEAVITQSKGFLVNLVDRQLNPEVAAYDRSLFNLVFLISDQDENKRIRLSSTEDFKSYLGHFLFQMMHTDFGHNFFANVINWQVLRLPRSEEDPCFSSLGFVIMKWPRADVHQYLVHKLAAALWSYWGREPTSTETEQVVDQAAKKTHDLLKSRRCDVEAAIADLMGEKPEVPYADYIQAESRVFERNSGVETHELPNKMDKADHDFEDGILARLLKKIQDKAEKKGEEAWESLSMFVCDVLDKQAGVEVAARWAGGFSKALKEKHDSIEIEIKSLEITQETNKGEANKAWGKFVEEVNRHKRKAAKREFDVYSPLKDQFYQDKLDIARKLAVSLMCLRLSQKCDQVKKKIETLLNNCRTLGGTEVKDGEKVGLLKEQGKLEELLNCRAYEPGDLILLYNKWVRSGTIANAEFLQKWIQECCPISKLFNATSDELVRLMQGFCSNVFGDIKKWGIKDFLDYKLREVPNFTKMKFEARLREMSTPLCPVEPAKLKGGAVPHFTFVVANHNYDWLLHGVAWGYAPVDNEDDIFYCQLSIGIPLAALSVWETAGPAYARAEASGQGALCLPKEILSPAELALCYWAEAVASQVLRESAKGGYDFVAKNNIVHHEDGLEYECFDKICDNRTLWSQFKNETDRVEGPPRTRKENRDMLKAHISDLEISIAALSLEPGERPARQKTFVQNKVQVLRSRAEELL